MAAVLALVMLPIVVSVCFFVAIIHSDASISSVFAGAVFSALSIGVLFGALRITRNAEQDSPLPSR